MPAKKIKKKDFDKEKMYAKIMPSIALAERSAESPEQEPESAAPPEPFVPEASVLELEPEQAAPKPTVPDAPPAPSPPPEPEEPGLRNYMEVMVRDKLEHTMKVLGACDCPRCRQDIMAIALNQLPCFYAVAEEGGEARYINKLRGAYEVKATASLIKAIQQVKTNPRH